MKNLNKFISPAKLNLYLEVNNKRKDGFHNLESLMTFCDLGDVIKIERSNSFELKIKGPFGKFLDLNENIILKVINGLENLYERKFKVCVTLEKNLPISSGMGGGSSNAATVIRAIHEIFGIKESKNLGSFLISIFRTPFLYSALISSSFKFLNKLNYHDQKVIVVVTHSGTIRAILSHLLGIDPDISIGIEISYLSISLFEVLPKDDFKNRGGKYRLLGINK